MSSKMSEKQIDELLTRGVGEFIDPDGSFRKKLIENPEKIVIKFGVDPTRPDLHLGHAVVLRKLRKFQDLGCKVIFLIGDFTGLIGDPTGKSQVRPEINHAEILANKETYLAQVDKILLKDEKMFSWICNSDWFTSINDIVAPEGRTTLNFGNGMVFNSAVPLASADIINKAQYWWETRQQRSITNEIRVFTTLSIISILRNITHGHLISRDMFQDRIEKGKELYMHEMLYPVLQGIDSTVLAILYGNCDLEIGGTDQTFNMFMGRDVMKMNKQKEQSIMAMKIIVGLDGKEKMSKSLDNYISITDKPFSMYSAVMSIPDSAIIDYLDLCTDISEEEIKNIMKFENPKQAKGRLAFEIVTIYHSEKDAKKAEEDWENTFSKGGIPTDVEEVIIANGTKLKTILVKNKIVESGNEFTRLLTAGAIKNAETDEKIMEDIEIKENLILKVGKRRFVKIIVK